MKYSVKPKMVCANQIDFELNGNIVTNVKFYGGCDGNLKGISSLVEGMTVEEIQKKLSGITCGFKSTSCPDQLCNAILEKYNSISEV